MFSSCGPGPNIEKAKKSSYQFGEFYHHQFFWDWSGVFKRPLIGWEWSSDLDTGHWLVESDPLLLYSYNMTDWAWQEWAQLLSESLYAIYIFIASPRLSLLPMRGQYHFKNQWEASPLGNQHITRRITVTIIMSSGPLMSINSNKEWTGSQFQFNSFKGKP